MFPLLWKKKKMKTTKMCNYCKDNFVWKQYWAMNLVYKLQVFVDRSRYRQNQTDDF